MNQNIHSNPMNSYPINSNLVSNDAHSSNLNEIGNHTGHGKYWHIPVHNYYDDVKNSYYIPQSCDIPQSTSEYCVNQQLQQTGDLELAISNCMTPSRTGVECTNYIN